jgi:hypothetical protein
VRNEEGVGSILPSLCLSLTSLVLSPLLSVYRAL